MAKINKCYLNYKELRKALKSKTYDILQDSIAQCNEGNLSVDITLRDYDGKWCIDYDVYHKEPLWSCGFAEEEFSVNKYLDGGKVCDVKRMPKTEKAFWKLISEKIEKHMEGCSDGK